MGDAIVSYGVGAEEYLARGRRRLAEGSAEALFYAAFELRCGIEARMQEYLEARQEILRKKRHGYQIAKLARGLERVFAGGDKIVELLIFESDGTPRQQLYFTPVRSSLRRGAAKLGDLLHARPTQLGEDHRWWGEQRALLEEMANELGLACFGTLMGPPLLEKATGRMSIVVRTVSDDPLRLTAQIGHNVVMKVSYLDTVPEEMLKAAERRGTNFG